MNLIEKWRAVIPPVNCRPGCSECCGVTPPMTKWELDQISRPYQITSPCFYLEGNRCAIYEHRPIICRLYGTVDGNHSLRCRSGAKPDRVFPPKQVDAIFSQWVELVKKTMPGHDSYNTKANQELANYLSCCYGVDRETAKMLLEPKGKRNEGPGQ